jgi:beta-glucosidase
VQHLGSAVQRPIEELKGFKRIHIGAGKETDVTFDLKPHDLAYWDAAAHEWKIEKEPIRVMAGGSSDDLPVHGDVNVESAGEYKP